jgi:hypothetical protein
MTFHPKKPSADLEHVRRHLGIATPRQVIPVPACMDADRNVTPERARD